MAPRIVFQLMQMMLALVQAIMASRLELALENLALRQQVAALKRERPRPPIAPPRLSEQARLFPRCHRQRFGWFQGIVRGRRHSLSLASWRRRVRSRWSSLRTWAFSAVRRRDDCLRPGRARALRTAQSA
jgi:hypothetical protein